ncbi:MAG: hypothetical protein A3A28_05120 [Candidatus Sungbacteria bacterium RIFCSPLOWO2_01_FULL_47_32]|uniref:Response regulatory domain-containing protein n=1 Tax=Candidatus Sungbacteria bacterium RIFCSPHIGHO2_01_FULL_47_32 TaxID=1802264 RepID=A0A1G2K5A2_9BACT|nr:MAG: hypothetical protein UX72_C0011G0029 [Parcubacteria group bacterium GW2011_GWA2_47_10]OGZ94614.1 MAG: hypothetical protein A2633_01185 [Candidatus Sungbacteria bacterium RIFCSPHIGHO2_01_FULL_47_32]OGZ98706.1 MAG: hypothetical protein A3D57_00265 [Candidatus Sungbacteria bacterium RIFCSPHIGHO2_02_FULL_46_12]OHA04856.1 MAG: hypothetical protein A3A28_05120 [Candidatus Sungbacteria bacterium RIFCSPLOWO2_01_FULL_47_32]
MIAERLTEAGYRVIQKGSGSDGFARAITEQSDIILLDLMLPETDGINFLSELRTNGEWGKNVPIVIISSLMPDEKLKENAQILRVRIH